MSPTLRDAFLLSGTLIAAASSGYVGWRLWQQPQSTPPVVQGEVMRGCDLQRGPCTASFPGGGHLTLVMSPRPVTPGTRFRIEVKLDNLVASAVHVDLGSAVMYMGGHRQRLDARSDSLFAGQAMLPVCTRDHMDWRLTVTVRTRNGVLGARFDFA
ncbi:MAG: hypothetical protein AABY86_04660, partial [Bdellovibrionota bacterium]